LSNTDKEAVGLIPALELASLTDILQSVIMIQLTSRRILRD